MLMADGLSHQIISNLKMVAFGNNAINSYLK